MRPVRTLAAAAIAATLISGVIQAAAHPANAEPQGSAGQQSVPPGPDVLNAPPPRAPQLENTGSWRAQPIMVCNTSAYRAGEYVHQGCVYDDQGAQSVPTKWPEHTLSFAYRYPTDPVYRQNAADIVEVRTKRDKASTASRITYNTMLDPKLVGTTIALGSSTKAREAPYGSNTRMPASSFVTVRGTTGDIVDADSGRTLASKPRVRVDIARRQLEVRVPNSAAPVKNGKLRVAVAAGLWDQDRDRFLLPQAVADRKNPGGRAANIAKPSAYFDVAYRFDEPFNSPWRNDQQKVALAKGDISKFYAEIDIAKLTSKKTDELRGTREGVPTSGLQQRLYATSSELRQGRRLPGDPGRPPVGAFTQQNGAPLNESDKISAQFGWVCRDDCVSDLPGQLQRYVAYLPKQPAPPDGYASMLWAPGYGQSANDQVNDSGTSGTGEIPGKALGKQDQDLFRKIGNNPTAPTVVISVDGRGNDNWAYGTSGASMFEALADARRVYELDPTRTVMAGFSSGAYSANKLALQFPDVFSKAFVCDGLNKAPSIPAINGLADTLPADTVTKHEPGSTLTPLLPNRRNQPVLEWSGIPNNYIPPNIPRERAEAYIAGDQYDFEFDTWLGPSSDHVIMCANGTWQVANDRLGDLRGPDNIFQVDYVRNPFWDDPKSGLVGDRAYWLSDIQTRDRELGSIEVKSHGFGLADAPAAAVKRGAKTATGTSVPVNSYTAESRDKPDPVKAPKQDRLDIVATNISRVTIDPKQAKISCAADLKVTTDGPLTVSVTGCADRSFG